MQPNRQSARTPSLSHTCVPNVRGRETRVASRRRLSWYECVRDSGGRWSMTSHVIEIARQEGTELRSVRLSVEEDGAIKMDAQDIGPTVTQIWGEDEYEF